MRIFFKIVLKFSIISLQSCQYNLGGNHIKNEIGFICDKSVTMSDSVPSI